MCCQLNSRTDLYSIGAVWLWRMKRHFSYINNRIDLCTQNKITKTPQCKKYRLIQKARNAIRVIRVLWESFCTTYITVTFLKHWEQFSSNAYFFLGWGGGAVIVKKGGWILERKICRERQPDVYKLHSKWPLSKNMKNVIKKINKHLGKCRVTQGEKK